MRKPGGRKTPEIGGNPGIPGDLWYPSGSCDLVQPATLWYMPYVRNSLGIGEERNAIACARAVSSAIRLASSCGWPAREPHEGGSVCPRPPALAAAFPATTGATFALHAFQRVAFCESVSQTLASWFLPPAHYRPGQHVHLVRRQSTTVVFGLWLITLLLLFRAQRTRHNTQLR